MGPVDEKNVRCAEPSESAKTAVRIVGRCGMRMLPAVLLVLLCAGAMAEPSRSVSFLMHEPISMLDWGLKNIEDHLVRSGEVLTRHEKNLFHAEPSIGTAYDWQEDVIRISIGLRLSDDVQKTVDVLTDVRKRVSFVMVYVRGLLTMNPYDAYFRHKGFRSRETPENLEQELSDDTELVVTVRDKDSNILSTCKGSLPGQDMVWMKIGEQ